MSEAMRITPASTNGSRLYCRNCGKRWIKAPDGATPDTRYVCPDCSGLPPKTTAFQEYAGDRKFRARKHHLTGDDGCAPMCVAPPATEAQTVLAEATVDGGVSVENKTRARKDAPTWIFDDDFLRRLTRKYARGQRTQIQVAALYLYYRCGVQHKVIAEEFGLTEAGVKKMIQRLVQRAERHLEKTLHQSNQELNGKPVPYSTVRGREMQQEVVIELLEEGRNEEAAA